MVLFPFSNGLRNGLFPFSNGPFPLSSGHLLFFVHRSGTKLLKSRLLLTPEAFSCLNKRKREKYSKGFYCKGFYAKVFKRASKASRGLLKLAKCLYKPIAYSLFTLEPFRDNKAKRQKEAKRVKKNERGKKSEKRGKKRQKSEMRILGRQAH